MPCNGNADQTCGGPNRLNLYTFNSKGLPTSTRSSAPTSTGATPTNGGNPDAPTQVTPTARPSSAVNETSILPYKYQGCYTDTSPGGRSLQNAEPDSNSMTVEFCIETCSSKGFNIAGLQYGVQCFCDRFLRNSPSMVDDSECSMNCAGSDAQKCGNGGRNSIYSNGTMETFRRPAIKTNDLPGNWTFAGCLQDNVNNQRVLPYELVFLKDNTNAKCLEICQKYGYGAAGTEYGEQCFW